MQNKILSDLLTEDDSVLAVVWLELLEWYNGLKTEQNESGKPYSVYSGGEAAAAYMLSLCTTAQSADGAAPTTAARQMLKYTNYVAENITAPVAGRISAAETETLLDSIDEKYGIIRKLFSERRLPILLLENSHCRCNSFCCSKRSVSGDGDYNYELFLFHKKDSEAGHPAYIFLHEIGPIVQMELTHDPEAVPKSFIKMSNEFLGTDIKQDIKTPELFADAFAIAMMTIFGWSEYDCFDMIPHKVKNSFATFMNWLLLRM